MLQESAAAQAAQFWELMQRAQKLAVSAQSTAFAKAAGQDFRSLMPTRPAQPPSRPLPSSRSIPWNWPRSSNRLARRDESLGRCLDRRKRSRGRQALSRQDLGGGPDEPRPARCASRCRRGGRQASRLPAQGVEGPSERGALTRQFLSALSPSNFLALNPAARHRSSKRRDRASWKGSGTCLTTWSMAKAVSRYPPTTRRRSLWVAETGHDARKRRLPE